MIVHPSRWKNAAFLVFGAAMAGGGVLMIRDGRATGWFVALFFALCVAVFGVQLLPGAT